MICERCQKKNAVVYYTQTVNSIKKGIHLCNECAEEMVMSKQGFNFDNSLFSGLFGGYFGDSFYGAPHKRSEGQAAFKDKICPTCGMSETELMRNGRFGCMRCYEVFADRVSQLLSKLHVSQEYKGKIPESVNKSLSLERKIEEMRKEMHEAVERQDYEEAARIRDAIRLLQSSCEGENEGGDNL